MKSTFTLLVAFLFSVSFAKAQSCMSDQIVGKRWICVGKESNGEKINFQSPYFYLTLEDDNRYHKSSFEDNKTVNESEGNYSINNCELTLSTEPKSIKEGVTRRVEEYHIDFNNDRYMTMSVTINGVLSRTYYCIYAGKPDRYRYGR